MLEFRTKTKERLNPEQLIILENLVNEVLSLSVYYVEDAIWHFTRDPQDVAGYYGFQEELTIEQISAVRGEIINQYRNQNPTWDYGKKYVKSPYKEKESIIALRKALRGDEVIFHKIMDMVLEYTRHLRYKIIGTKAFQRTQKLLLSDYEKLQDMGLRELGFKCLEAEFLQPYSKEIGNVLGEMCSITE